MAALSRTVSSLSRRPQLASLQPARQMSSLFGHVEPAAKDPILGVTEAFLADQSPDNVNVGVVRAPLRSPRSLAVGLACLFWCFCSV
jgi:aspartate aminotransferase, mitochondrial